MNNKRLRDLGIAIGTLPPGPLNAITDVSGVWVGHVTVLDDTPPVARTGVTVILPRGDGDPAEALFAGVHSFNGCGEMTGMAWIEESGLLESPIGLSNTFAIGAVHEGLVRWAVEHGTTGLLPVAAETYDGWLNAIDAFHVRPDHVAAALAAAGGGPVAEGNVGGGTGMICHEFKGGIGTASRVVNTLGTHYTVGVLVQANYGRRGGLRVAGVPVGQTIGPDRVPLPWSNPVPWNQPTAASSIIAVVATDAPLLPGQCRRLAARATVGLARVGGVGYTTSGDLFLAFSTANRLAPRSPNLYSVQMLPHDYINPLFDAVAEATEEAILNALVAAETLTGHDGHTAHALPHDLLQAAMTPR